MELVVNDDVEARWDTEAVLRVLHFNQSIQNTVADSKAFEVGLLDEYKDGRAGWSIVHVVSLHFILPLSRVKEVF